MINEEIRRFLRISGMPRSTFGRKAVGDPGLVQSIFGKGRVMRPSTVAKLREFMDNYQPGEKQ